MALLGAGHRLGMDAGALRRKLDDLLIDVAEAEPLGHRAADLLASGADVARDADDVVGHAMTLYDGVARRAGQWLWPAGDPGR